MKSSGLYEEKIVKKKEKYQQFDVQQSFSSVFEGSFECSVWPSSCRLLTCHLSDLCIKTRVRPSVLLSLNSRAFLSVKSLHVRENWGTEGEMKDVGKGGREEHHLEEEIPEWWWEQIMHLSLLMFNHEPADANPSLQAFTWWSSPFFFFFSPTTAWFYLHRKAGAAGWFILLQSGMITSSKLYVLQKWQLRCSTLSMRSLIWLLLILT